MSASPPTPDVSLQGNEPTLRANSNARFNDRRLGKREFRHGSGRSFFLCSAGHKREWIVEARWPDGLTEMVEIFADYFEALQWLSTQSTIWLEQRIAVKEAG